MLNAGFLVQKTLVM